ncbi:transcription antiterminator BglG [Heyndrickxia shackletonii]|uniref:Transcription antiterminator BglG n=1 Tax=Heyndrickxia shackletonii TaxID=157838 RepID=A0A0Q3WTT3_9BACI|nr:PRD domain-containing protein [Heyndrickxia shackletonii]KQL51581.1 transcription antiterminator BglG [Heyndrickxia shackletonii]MBB2481545.1 PRD domain-containing protein [Bacillus sp. APMAM]NEY98469.1 PRD domain-containing protein [Heyndrickxia shackletonii]RTZ55104.1 PRD domain-containing protein [Bacillus sp. SAJ1]
MEIKKILNNNVVVSTNELNQEIVVMGRGLAFQKKVGESIDESKIEKTFVLETRGISEKLAKLLRDTSEVYLNISAKILDYAQTHLPFKLDEYLYVALTDHISFAISRHKQGIHLTNPLLWEIRKYYKQEFQVALKALAIIEKETGIALGEDEAASIALHLVNSQISGENMAAAVQITEMVNTILNIVKYHFKMELDENSVNYERFLTHLRFFAVRFVRKEKLEETVDQFFIEQIQLKYPEAYSCTQKIATYLENQFNWGVTKDEEIYLTVHIHRVTNRHKMK